VAFKFLPSTTIMSRFEGTADLSNAPSVFLPIAIRDIHDEVAKSDLSPVVFVDTMTKAEYARYLMALWHIYRSALPSSID
jgi:hypothetical protein